MLLYTKAGCLAIKTESDEKGNLDEEAYRASKRVDGMIAILPVIGRENHVLLVALEVTLNARDARRHLPLYLAFFLLKLLRLRVEGQAAEAHRDAHAGYRDPGVSLEYPVEKHVDDLDDEPYGIDDHLE